MPAYCPRGYWYKSHHRPVSSSERQRLPLRCVRGNEVPGAPARGRRGGPCVSRAPPCYTTRAASACIPGESWHSLPENRRCRCSGLRDGHTRPYLGRPAPPARQASHGPGAAECAWLCANKTLFMDLEIGTSDPLHLPESILLLFIFSPQPLEGIHPFFDYE